MTSVMLNSGAKKEGMKTEQSVGADDKAIFADQPAEPNVVFL